MISGLVGRSDQWGLAPHRTPSSSLTRQSTPSDSTIKYDTRGSTYAESTPVPTVSTIVCNGLPLIAL